MSGWFQIYDMEPDQTVTVTHYPSETFLLTLNVLNGKEGTTSDLIPIEKELVYATLNMAASIASERKQLTNENVPPLDVPELYNPGQIKIDRKMREYEAELLRGKPIAVTPSAKRIEVEIGTEEDFWVNRNDEDVLVTATCQKVGQSCYIFVDNAAPRDVLTQGFIDETAAFFDSTAYPTDTNVFGESTDTDSDPRIYIVFSQLTVGSGWRTLGYFWARDKYPASEIPHSNQHDMFYLTIPSSDSDLETFKSVLGHEFQHMINFDRHRADGAPPEQVWLNESLSELAGFICTENWQFRVTTVADYFNNPVSLTVWDYENTLPNYAAAFLFGVYLYDRYYLAGEDDRFFLNMVGSRTVGLKNVAEQTGIPFDTLFKQWNAALYLSDFYGLTTDPAYQYTSINIRSNGLSGLIPELVSVDGSSYGGEYYPYTPVMLILQVYPITTAVDIQMSLHGENAGGEFIIDVVYNQNNTIKRIEKKF